MSSTNPRYLIGIDLGTSSSSLSFIDLKSKDPSVKVMDIPQWNEKEELTSKKTLASSILFPLKSKYFPSNSLPLLDKLANHSNLKEGKIVVGEAAKNYSFLTPERVAHSAKSWLSCIHINDETPLLPWQSSVIKDLLSPLEASAEYLSYLAACWNHTVAHQDDKLNIFMQKVVLTVPASFSTTAIKRTLDAAKKSGFLAKNLTLVEEPIAAAYTSAFSSPKPDQRLQIHSDLVSEWKDHWEVKTKKVVLIIDIGGGTTDLSLMEISFDKKNGFHWQRVAVSSHILLGGDNIDLFIAHHLATENPIKEGWYGRTWRSLIQLASKIKVKIFSEDSSKVQILRETIVLEQGGLFSAKKIDISVNCLNLQTSILDAFFPMLPFETKVKKSESNFSEWGLPYANDSRITAHIANFLNLQGTRHIDSLLFHGGTLKPQAFQKRIYTNILDWVSSKKISVLPSAPMDTGVSQGAAIYAWLRYHNQHNFTEQRCAKSYLLKVKSGKQDKLLCIRARGTRHDDVTETDIEGLAVKVNQKVIFSLIEDEAQTSQQCGQINPVPQNTLLHKNKQLITTVHCSQEEKTSQQAHPVKIQSMFSPSGQLILTLINKTSPFRKLGELQFDEEKSSPQATQAISKTQAPTYDEADFIQDTFKSKKWRTLSNEHHKFLKAPLEVLESRTKKSKESWTLARLRELCDDLIQLSSTRRRSPEHEKSWLNLTGFTLRPGVGHPDDSSRMAKIADVINQGLQYPQHPGQKNAWFSFIRRIAGGLTHKQQIQLFMSNWPKLKNNTIPEQAWMSIASLERIPQALRAEVAEFIVRQFEKSSKPDYSGQKLWALTRLSSRAMLYSPKEFALSSDLVSDYVLRMAKIGKIENHAQQLQFFYTMASLEQNNPEVAISNSAIKVASKIKPAHNYTNKKTTHQAATIAHERLLGDSIPCGLELSF